MLRRTVQMTVGLALGATLLAGCGGDQDDEPKASASDQGDSAYCADLAEAQELIASFTSPTMSPDLSKFGTMAETMEALAAEAPDATAEHWELLTTRLGELTDVLQKTGADLQAVVGSMATGDLPAGMTQEEWAEVGAKLSELTGPEVKAAGDAINAHAKEECGVDLSKAG